MKLLLTLGLAIAEAESGYKSDCFDRRITVCKDLSDLKNAPRDKCLRFFPEDMCDGKTPDDKIPRCTTVVKNYCKDFVKDVINWTPAGPAQVMINDLLYELPLTDGIRAAGKLANIENDAEGEFNDFAQSLSSMLDHLFVHHESLSDEEFDFFLGQLREEEHINLIRNLAGFVELERIMSDSEMWTVDVDELAMTRGYASTFPLERKWMSQDNWTKENVINVMSFAAHFAGAAENINVEEMADTAGSVFFDDIVSSQQSAESAVRSVKSSGKVYEELVKNALKFMNVNKRVRRAYNLTIKDSRRREIATIKDLKTKLIASAREKFNAAVVVQMRKSFETPVFKNLEVVYELLAVAEQNADVDDAFGCDRGCDFTAINWRS